MQIRFATKNDIADLIRLNDQIQHQHARQYPDMYLYPLDAAKLSNFFEDLISSERNHVLVAIDDHDIRAYLYYEQQMLTGSLFKVPVKRYYVHHVMVESGVRRSGIASALFDWVEKEARMNGVNQVSLDTMELNESAQKFFQSCGYSNVVRVMSKQLS